uniref:Uncharacterized protein n=1 Tax=Oryza glumipatula TaxID=40148 RepID=A0A0D9Z0M4_9ORYZ
METSLRLRGGGSRPQTKSQEGLRIHAKEKLPIASNALLQGSRCQAQTWISTLAQVKTLASLAEHRAVFLLSLEIRTKAISSQWHILLFSTFQGSCGTTPLNCALILVSHRVNTMPYFQLRENNWTFNAYMDGKWDVRFDL